MDKSKGALIEQLETISNLRYEALKIIAKMYTFKPIDKYERKIKVPKFPTDDINESVIEFKDKINHKDNDAIKNMEIEYDNLFCPQKPKLKTLEQPQSDTSRVKKYKEEKFLKYLLACVFAIISLPSIFLNCVGFESSSISFLIMFVISLFFIIKYTIKFITLKKEDEESTKNALIEYEQKKRVSEEIYNIELKEYEAKLNSHNLLKEKFIEDYKNWREIYLKSLNEESKIAEQLEKERTNAFNKIKKEEYQPIITKLENTMQGILPIITNAENMTQGILTNKYLNNIDFLINYLKSNRADTIKEAIEVLEEELYRKKALEILKEHEEERQRKEEQRQLKEEERQRKEDKFRNEQISILRRQTCTNYSYSCKFIECSKCTAYKQE